MQTLRDRLKPTFYMRMTVVCTLFAFFLIWVISANRDPVIVIPKPVLPHTNAFDFYVAAGKTMKDERQIVDAVSRKPSKSYSFAQKEALLQENAGVVEKLRQGFASPYLNPPARSWSGDLFYYTKFRGLAGLLSLQGQMRAAHGDWNGAAENYLDALRLGADMPHGSPLAGDIHGIACQNIGRRPMWNAVEHLDAAHTHVAIGRLTNIMDRHVPFLEVIQEEKWYGQASRLEFFGKTGKPYPTLPSDAAESKDVLDLSMVYMIRSKQRIMDDFVGYMDRSAQIARQPYSLHTPPPSLPTDMLNAALTLLVLNYRIKDVESEAQNGLLLITLALHAFRLEHGHYPTGLTELVPASLPKLPDDPFAAQGTFKYRPEGKRYVLYSVGPDGKDDNGTPIDDPSRLPTPHPETRYDVLESSIGDVVAGTNKQ